MWDVMLRRWLDLLFWWAPKKDRTPRRPEQGERKRGSDTGSKAAQPSARPAAARPDQRPARTEGRGAAKPAARPASGPAAVEAAPIRQEWPRVERGRRSRRGQADPRVFDVGGPQRWPKHGRARCERNAAAESSSVRKGRDGSRPRRSDGDQRHRAGLAEPAARARHHDLCGPRRGESRQADGAAQGRAAAVPGAGAALDGGGAGARTHLTRCAGLRRR